MAYGKTNNTGGRAEDISVNTKGTQFYNQSMGSTLILGHWNNLMTIKICPVLGETQRSEGKTYDYENGISTAITVEKGFLLIKAIKEVMQGDENTFGVPVGSNFVEIGRANKIVPNGEDMPDGIIALAIYQNVDQEGAYEKSLTYVFNSGELMTNYRGKADGFDRYTVSNIEVEMFALYLKESVAAHTNAIAHSIRNNNKWSDRRQQNDLAAIKEKMGISNDNVYKKSGAGSSTQFFGGNRDGGSGAPGVEKDGGYIQNGTLPTL